MNNAVWNYSLFYGFLGFVCFFGFLFVCFCFFYWITYLRSNRILAKGSDWKKSHSRWSCAHISRKEIKNMGLSFTLGKLSFHLFVPKCSFTGHSDLYHPRYNQFSRWFTEITSIYQIVFAVQYELPTGPRRTMLVISLRVNRWWCAYVCREQTDRNRNKRMRTVRVWL